MIRNFGFQAMLAVLIVFVAVLTTLPLAAMIRHYIEHRIDVIERRTRHLLHEAKKRARKKGLVRVSCQVAEGNPAQKILSAAADVDMIFLGSRGLSDAKGLLMGSVSHKVTNLATRTCVTVK